MSQLHLTPNELDNNLKRIQYLINGQLSIKNFQGRSISGITDSTAHTSKIFKHQLAPPPQGGFVLLGNVYIYSITNTHVDIRSSQSSVNFTIFLLNG